MKKNIPPKYTKKDFDKVFENPLDWCPLFGYLPDIEEYDVCDDKTVLDLVESCLDIINDCRDNFGFDYRPNLHMKKYVCLPDVKYLLPHADDDVIVYIKSLRRLFRNLDFLSLKTASLYDFSEALVNAINISHKTIRTEITFPEKPIGRVSNLYNNALSVIAEDIRLDRTFWHDSILLEEARKLSCNAEELDCIKLISLCAILEVWLIVTRLLLKPKHEKEGLLYCMERLAYAKELKNIAEHHKDHQHLSSIYEENMATVDHLKNEIDYEVTTPWSPRKQSLRAKKKAEEEAKVLKPRNKAIEDKVADFLKDNNKDRRHISVQFVYDKIKRDFPAIIGELKIRQFENIAGYLIRDFKKRTKVSNKQ